MATWLCMSLSLASSLCLAVAQDIEGRIAFYSNRDGNDEIYAMNPDGSGLVNLTRDPARDLEPVWSPDGSKIAFRSNRDGNWEVYVVNVDGSGLRNLTNNSAYDTSPAWSPDASKIAFVSSRNGPGRVYIVNADGSGERQLTSNPGQVGQFQTVSLTDLAWSPEGTEIVLLAGDLDSVYTNVAMVRVDTGELRLVTSGADRYSRPRWSPDGSRIVCDCKREGNSDIYVMDERGRYPGMPIMHRLTDDPANDWFPVWSPDGTRIAFASERDTNWEIYVIRADGTGLSNLTNNAGNDRGATWGASP